MTIHLLRAEWLKLRRMNITWAMLVIPTALALLGSTIPVASLRNAARYLGPNINESIRQFAFPQPMLFGLQIDDFLGSLLVLVFITSIVGNEYHFDTWKNLLTRHAGHGRLLLTKLAYALIASAILLIAVPLIFQAGTLVALRTVLDWTPTTLTLSSSEAREIASLAVTAGLRMIIAACMGLLAAVTARSSGGGFAIAAPWMVADSIVSSLGFAGGLWNALAPFTFNYNLTALAANLSGGRGLASVGASLIVLSIYTLGFTVLAITLFRQRDIAG